MIEYLAGLVSCSHKSGSHYANRHLSIHPPIHLLVGLGIPYNALRVGSIREQSAGLATDENSNAGARDQKNIALGEARTLNLGISMIKVPRALGQSVLLCR